MTHNASQVINSLSRGARTAEQIKRATGLRISAIRTLLTGLCLAGSIVKSPIGYQAVAVVDLDGRVLSVWR